MSWKALDWATDSDIGTPTMKLILILLANKADERFSCFPSVKTLSAESGAGRSTVLHALNMLEQAGLITRVAQYHESGAQRASRYFLNHPQAPHVLAGQDPDYPGPDPGRGPSRRKTERVQHSDSPRVQQQDAFNPPVEPPSEPSELLRHLPNPWRLSRRDVARLSPEVERALASGWTMPGLQAHLSQNPDGVRNAAAVLTRRLAELPQPPTGSNRSRAPWCGECGDDRSRTISITLPDGTDAVQFCPRCSPQSQFQSSNPHVSNFQSTEE